MKNITNEIIQSLSKQELREFKYFLCSGNNGTGNREDLKLLEHIRDGTESNYKNVNAAHQTKKRLKKKLEQFAILENLRHDSFSRLHSMTEMAKYLFRKNLHKQAWEYLIKAEQLAINAEEYYLLDYNYNIQLTYSYNIATHPPEGFSVPTLLRKKQDNKALAETDSNANAAYAHLIYELREQFSKQLSIDIDVLSGNILKQYHLTDNIYDNMLRIYCKIVNLVCRALREKREYRSLKNYAINSYKIIEKRKALNKIAPEFMIDLLDAICIASLRSKDYKTCEKYTSLYEIQAKQMQAHPEEYSYYDFILHIDICDLCFCTNKLAEAEQAMLTAYKKYAHYTDSPRIHFLLRINLLAVLFACGRYDECIKIYNEIKTLNEKKILNEPGFRLEFILLTDINCILYHYEENDTEYALYLLEKIKRKYNVLLKTQDSKRERFFLTIVEKMIIRPTYIKTASFLADTRQFIKMKEFIPGDFEYISMGAWLNSKTTNTSYYDCFLEMVR